MKVQQGWPDLDARLCDEVAQILDLPDDAVSMRALLGSVFHGISLLVSVRFDKPPALATRRRRLSRAPFSFGPQTPADLGESQSIHVSDLGDEGGGRVGLWIVADNLRGGCVANGVAIAQALAARAGEGS
jgi:aspartate-semialdehyde dehydrogenase